MTENKTGDKKPLEKISLEEMLKKQQAAQPEKDEHIYCYKCSKPLSYEIDYKISRQEECINCRTSLRCCKMCEFFDMTIYNECREPMAERILDKEKVNFCSYFQVRRGKFKGKEPQDLRAAASALFKK